MTALTPQEEKYTRRSALVAGLGLLVMVLTVPFAEFGILPELVALDDPAKTWEQITAHRGRFNLAIGLYVVTLLMDFVVAFALYLYFRPTHNTFSAVVASLRVVYTLISLTAVYHLVEINPLINYADASQSPEQLGTLAIGLVKSFRSIWALAFWIFAAYLILLGVLAYRSTYVPRWVALAVLVAGLGYLLDSLRPYLAPDAEWDWLFVTFMGELVFMVWLLVKGWRVKLS